MLHQTHALFELDENTHVLLTCTSAHLQELGKLRMLV